MHKLRISWYFGLSSLLLGITTSAWASSDAVINPTSDYGGQVTDLFWLVMAICGAFFALVIGVMAILFFRFRAKKPGEEGRAFHGNLALEIIWTTIPFLVMFYLAWVSADLVNVQLRAPSKTLIVKVVAYQFGWDYEYFESVPNGTGADIQTIKNICGNPAAMVTIRKLNVKSSKNFVVPINVAVRFLVSSRDVIHSFWVPDFLIKRDTVPGLVSDMWFTPTKLGTYPVVCAALCGPDHARMTGSLTVVDKASFDSWLLSHSSIKKEVKKS